MREVLKNIISDAILFEYELPNNTKNIEKSCYSDICDHCYSNKSWEKTSELIYNGIVDYANNEYKIDITKLDIEQRKAIRMKIRYNEDANDETKLKYGFFGEVILYSILMNFYNTDVLVAKGFFFNPLERSEPKGYDSFHLVERNEEIELWFGEAKFYVNYKEAINRVLHDLSNALSDEYLNRNFLCIYRRNL